MKFGHMFPKRTCVLTLCSLLLTLTAEAQFTRQETPAQYEKRINDALHELRDVWGEEMIASGGATYEKMQGYLRPLFYSAGIRTWEEQGVHNILFAQENGVKPLYVALCDGSRIALNRYDSTNDMTLYVGATGSDVFGSDLSRLDGPRLGGGFYPILQTAYVSQEGVRYEQQSFATFVPCVNSLVAMTRITVCSPVDCAQTLRIVHGADAQQDHVAFSEGSMFGRVFMTQLYLEAERPHTLYYFWSPDQSIREIVKADAETYDRGMNRWKEYWNAALERGSVFNVPEQKVMDSQRNLLIQNLVLRHRYSLGNGAYDEDVFHPETGDAATTLLQYGYAPEARQTLESLYGFQLRSYYFWEKGERLAHGAEYYDFTRDDYFLNKWFTEYQSYLDDFVNAIKLDPRGMLTPQALSSDISSDEYYTHSQTVAWRGMRDAAKMLEARGLLKNKEVPEYVQRLRDSIEVAVDRSIIDVGDGTLFLPVILYDKKREVYTPITQTRLGSYWNLVIPYAFDSGLFDYRTERMTRMVDFMHCHGGLMLGMLRFNFYGTPIGSYRKNAIPAYYTTGVDNVYLLSYLRTIAQMDDAERLIVSFYGRMVHGQTPETFCSGEGDNIGVYPGIVDRCSFGSWNNGNNATWLQCLRLLLLRESHNPETGDKENLYIAHAVPRQWLEQGKVIEFEDAPTLFGNVSCRIVSDVAHDGVHVDLSVPTRDPIKGLYLKLRLPDGKRMRSVVINGAEHAKFDPQSEVIDLSGMTGKLSIAVTCK